MKPIPWLIDLSFMLFTPRDNLDLYLTPNEGADLIFQSRDYIHETILRINFLSTVIFFLFSNFGIKSRVFCNLLTFLIKFIFS